MTQHEELQSIMHDLSELIDLIIDLCIWEDIRISTISCHKHQYHLKERKLNVYKQTGPS